MRGAGRSSAASWCGVVRAVVPALSACLLLAPKLLLIEFSADRLWLACGPGELPWLLAQDLLLALVALLLARALLAGRVAARHVAAGALGAVALTLLLLLDGRARQLWLQPPDRALLAYGWAQRHDLAGGGDLFFRHAAGLGLSFRRWVVLLVGAQLTVWALGGWALRGAPRAAVRARWPWLVGALAAAALALGAPRYRYRLEECQLVEPWLGRLRAPLPAPPPELAGACDQPARPLATALAAPRRIATAAPPFRSVVLYLLESVRWRGLNLDGAGPTPMPTLRRLAGEGLLARCYVSVPHSSKAAWTVLTGRYPYPGIEMREAMSAGAPSPVAALRARGAGTWVFSSAHLAFENMGGLFRAVGFERCLESAALVPSGAGGAGTSFGGGDEHLPAAADLLARDGRPFAALFVPIAPHYPYDWPGKPHARDDLESYRRSQTWADQVLAGVLERLAARGLLQETLVVLVGDHGESFGEHGSFAHNNSLHEEEVVVPLVLWSADGRLRHPGVLEARQVDVAPTLADLMGLEDSPLPVQGRSLLRGDGPPPPAYLTTFFDDVAWAVVEGGEKRVWTPSSGQVLRYDLRVDPEERRPQPLAGEAREATVRRLMAFAAHQRRSFRPGPGP